MPEGDTIARAASVLNAALAGRQVTGFRSVMPGLARLDASAMRLRTVERVEARGKHLLIWFSGNLGIRTHMRMHGSWHLYRPGERWQRPAHEMRIVVATEAFEAVGFAIPVAEIVTTAAVARDEPLASIGPDLLSPDLDLAAAVPRVAGRANEEIANVLLDQRVVAGIGNVLKSETLFVAHINPFVAVSALSHAQIERLLSTAARLLHANARTDRSGRSTTGWRTPRARLWVYGRSGLACRVCGTAIASRRQGPHARSTYWCPHCQP